MFSAPVGRRAPDAETTTQESAGQRSRAITWDRGANLYRAQPQTSNAARYVRVAGMARLKECAGKCGNAILRCECLRPFMDGAPLARDSPADAEESA